MEEIAITCPTCGVAMMHLEGSKKHVCQICKMEIKAESWGSSEKREEVSIERIKESTEKADQILKSPLDRKVTLNLTVGGEWAKRLTALQTLAGAVDIDETKVMIDVVRFGITQSWEQFMQLYQFRESGQQMVKDGVLSKETVDNLFRDMTNIHKKMDEDWKAIEGESEK